MALLDRLRLSGHLNDAALAAIWTDGRPGHPHLDSCGACRARFAEFSGWLETMRVDAVTEADQHFSAERLSAQQAQIFRRLEAAERPARVIAFPACIPVGCGCGGCGPCHWCRRRPADGSPAFAHAPSAGHAGPRCDRTWSGDQIVPDRHSRIDSRRSIPFGARGLDLSRVSSRAARPRRVYAACW
jgi:hypothetical protein